MASARFCSSWSRWTACSCENWRFGFVCFREWTEMYKSVCCLLCFSRTAGNLTNTYDLGFHLVELRFRALTLFKWFEPSSGVCRVMNWDTKLWTTWFQQLSQADGSWQRLCDRSIARPLHRSVARSLGRSIARSPARSLSLGRLNGRSFAGLVWRRSLLTIIVRLFIFELFTDSNFELLVRLRCVYTYCSCVRNPIWISLELRSTMFTVSRSTRQTLYLRDWACFNNRPIVS